MTTSDLFEQHFARTPLARQEARDPRSARQRAAIRKAYRRYLRMGFDPQEASFKAYHYHTSKL